MAGIYRLSYGNGQVGNSVSKAEAELEFKNQVQYDMRNHQSSGGLSIQKKDLDTGEWFTWQRLTVEVKRKFQ